MPPRRPRPPATAAASSAAMREQDSGSFAGCSICRFPAVTAGGSCNPLGHRLLSLAHQAIDAAGQPLAGRIGKLCRLFLLCGAKAADQHFRGPCLSRAMHRGRCAVSARASMFRRSSVLSSPRAAAALLLLLAAGCSVQTQKGFVLFGNWSIGWTRNITRTQRCPGADCTSSCGDPAGGCNTPAGGCNEATANNGDGQCEIAMATPPEPRGCHLRQPGPPLSVHNRFHPVPTRPVFGTAPVASNRKGLETLPREYESTPRIKSELRPELDPEELKDAKEKAQKADEDEERQLLRNIAP